MSEKKEIETIECRHVVHFPMPDGQTTDLHMVKEIIHYKDGTTEPNIRYIKNFKREYFITIPGRQNYKDKKEWTEIENVKRYESTQTDLMFNIAKSLKNPGFRGNMKKLSRSPYLYGSDILSTAVIKERYMRNAKKTTASTAAPFDVETDVLYDDTDGHIIMATLSFGSRVVTAVQSRFLKGISDPVRRAHEAFHKYLGHFEAKDTKSKDKNKTVFRNLIEERKLQWDFVIVDTEIDVIRHVFKRAHEWKPDFVSIWNINFDIKRVLEACQRARVEPQEIFCDPSVPKPYRFFEYVEGPKQMKSASGKVTPLTPPNQWHTAYVPASFYLIDAMAVYRRIRAAKGEKPSYSLDYTLNDELGMRKLSFKEADAYSKIDWHRFMQKNYPIEYVIYNVFDCIGMELLEEQTHDLGIALPMQTGYSDYRHFKSQPRRTADILHYYCQENGKVVGSTSDQMENEHDKLTLSLRNWITTLPAHLVVENGVKALRDYPHLSTNIRAHVGD